MADAEDALGEALGADVRVRKAGQGLRGRDPRGRPRRARCASPGGSKYGGLDWPPAGD